MRSHVRAITVLAVLAVAGTGVAVAANPAAPQAAPAATYYPGTVGSKVAPIRYDAAIRDDNEWGAIYEGETVLLECYVLNRDENRRWYRIPVQNKYVSSELVSARNVPLCAR
ncbi:MULTISPECIES: hypothetical protein [unclassified Streptomyces]|uniref:hypothetical protein n=1 Tax=unclassified Streptomyces TaxID=2593676 RepID=UPI002E2BADAC|nr:hypothetical protein [Streptomyces sp. NBC_01429]